MNDDRSTSSEDGDKLAGKFRRVSSSDLEFRASGKSNVHRLYKQEQDKSKQMKLGSKVDGFERQGQAWFVATELQSDLVVQVDDLKFHLHKFPLLSRSGRLNRLVFESRDTEKDHIDLTGIPGGPDSFELAAKFCYGMAIDLTAANVAGLRCAAEYLEMTEDLEEGNLISKTEAFLSFMVLGSWKDSLTVLKCCEKLSPWSENLQLVRRCSESIAWKACTDTRGINWSTIGKESSSRKSDSPESNEMRSSEDSKSVPADWWFEDLLTLSVDHFLKVIAAIKVKGMRSDLLGAVVTSYVLKWVPGLSRDTGYFNAENNIHMTASTGQDDFTVLQNKTQKLLENIVGILPLQQDTVSCSFLLRLLRIANMHGTSTACRAELEKRVGMQLENASLADLLVPSFLHTCETLYDVDLMQRLLQYFLLQEQVTQASPSTLEQQLGFDGAMRSAKVKVAKLLDGYLSEVARDQNLSLAKFQALVEAFPDSVRTSDDGLYKAIDTYLKVHPGLTELERKRLCRGMDCQRLSSDACLHASQNERLPLRVVVQVLFSEQVKLKNALSPVFGKDMDGWDNPQQGDGFHPLVSDSWAQELKAVKADLEQVKEKLAEFQSEYSLVRQQLQKLLGPKEKNQHSSSSSSWSMGWKKLRRASNLFHRDGMDDPEQRPSYVVQKDAIDNVAKPRLRRNSLS
ncbi:root phototropism protein 3 [Selaginella moellendorffii]|nr:root phototropism protein 3 [Selaginella moellendorffii]|eukprot:XP_002988207.2 root phototropism protein 3 [Selaginella moellendorffii]